MIHFSINKNLFLQALNTTKRAISSKNAIPILSTVKIDVTNEGVTLIGSNGQISIENFISQKGPTGLLHTPQKTTFTISYQPLSAEHNHGKEDIQ